MRDVVIVGGGPVGMLLACLLAVRGIDVEVLEQRTAPSMRSRAIGIHPPSMRALAEIGLADEVLARAVQIRAGQVRSDGRMLGRLSFEGLPDRHPFIVALPQYETEALLRQRFAELRPNGLRLGQTVTGIADQGDHADLHVQDSHEGAADAGTAGTVSARWVVAADGGRSFLRGLAGITVTAHRGGDSYLMADFADDGAHGSDAVLFFEPDGVVESFPLPGTLRRWVARTDAASTDAAGTGSLGTDAAGTDAAGPDAAETEAPAEQLLRLVRLVRERTGVVLPDAATPASAFTVQQGLPDRLVCGRVILVGDSAHLISPIGGQGMNLGWLDSLALAPTLERALGRPAAAATLLDRYDRRRRRTARLALRQASFNMAMGRPVHGVRLRLRNGAVRMLALPPASSLLARAFTMRWLQ